MPGFPSQYTEEQWQAARDLVASGLTFVEVSDKTGIGLDNLYQKSHREEWFVPSTALAKAQKVLEAQRNAKNDQESQNGQVSASVRTAEIMAESIAEIGQKGQIHALRGMLPRFLRTFEEGSPLLSKDVEDWKTAGSMVNIFSKLAQLDKPQTGIQVNVWGDGWGAQGAVPVESSEVEIEE